MDPYTLLAVMDAAQTLVDSVAALNGEADSLAAEQAKDVRELVYAPLNEGLARLELAALAGDPTRAEELAAQARDKLIDASARTTLPARARALAAGTAAALAARAGQPREAGALAEQALALLAPALTGAAAALDTALAHATRAQRARRAAGTLAAPVDVALRYLAAGGVDRQDLAALCGQAAATAAVAAACGVDLTGHICGVHVVLDGATGRLRARATWQPNWPAQPAADAAEGRHDTAGGAALPGSDEYDLAELLAAPDARAALRAGLVLAGGLAAPVESLLAGAMPAAGQALRRLRRPARAGAGGTQTDTDDAPAAAPEDGAGPPDRGPGQAVLPPQQGDDPDR